MKILVFVLALILHYTSIMMTQNVAQALKTRMVRVDYISLADLRRLIAAGFTVIFVTSPIRSFK